MIEWHVRLSEAVSASPIPTPCGAIPSPSFCKRARLRLPPTRIAFKDGPSALGSGLNLDWRCPQGALARCCTSRLKTVGSSVALPKPMRRALRVGVGVVARFALAPWLARNRVLARRPLAVANLLDRASSSLRVHDRPRKWLLRQIHGPLFGGIPDRHCAGRRPVRLMRGKQPKSIVAAS